MIEGLSAKMRRLARERSAPQRSAANVSTHLDTIALRAAAAAMTLQRSTLAAELHRRASDSRALGTPTGDAVADALTAIAAEMA